MLRFQQALILSACAGILVACSAVMPPSFPPASSSGTSVSFKADVAPLLRQHCAACHAQGGAMPILFDASGHAEYEAVRLRSAEIIDSIRSGRMPPGKPTAVSTEQLNMLQSWRDGGAPNN